MSISEAIASAHINAGLSTPMINREVSTPSVNAELSTASINTDVSTAMINTTLSGLKGRGFGETAQQETFDILLKNLYGYAPLGDGITYDGNGDIATKQYDTDNGTIIFTFNYTVDGDIDSIVLTGTGVPAGIPTTKQFNYDESGNLLLPTYL